MYRLATILLSLLLILGCSTTPHTKVDPHRAMVTIGLRVIHIKNGTPTGKVGTFMGTGFSVGHDGENSYVVTAAHLCEHMTVTASTIPLPMMLMKSVGKPRPYLGIPVESDKATDLCLIKVPATTFASIKIDIRKPLYKERVLLYASPRGYWEPGVAPVFDGRYIGSNGKQDVYTVPCASGCSGGPITTLNGRLVGVYLSKARVFDHLGFSAPFDTIRDFIKKCRSKHNFR